MNRTRDTAHPLIDIDAVAARLGVSVRHVRRLVFERRIPYLKWGHLLRFDITEIDEWIDAHRSAPAPLDAFTKWQQRKS